MLRSDTLVISAPAHELSDCAVPGSVFDATQLNEMNVSTELRQAVALLTSGRRTTLCVARPELYTHGAARRWLGARLGAIRCHVNLSDGTAIKLINGLDNHLFLYGLARHRCQASLRNLLTWAPEILLQLRSQLNSLCSVCIDGRLVAPPTTVLLPAVPITIDIPQCYTFFLLRHSPAESARRVIEAGAVPVPVPGSFRELVYVPITEASLHDTGFVRLVSQTIARAYVDRHQCIVVRLPELDGANLLQQIEALLTTVRDCGTVLPRVSSTNVLLAHSDLPESYFASLGCRLSMIFNDSFDFWRYTRRHYAQLHVARYLQGGSQAQSVGGMPKELQGIFGRTGRPRRRSRQQPRARIQTDAGRSARLR